MNGYRRALAQLDKLTALLRSGRAGCAVAEEEDLILTRLNDLKSGLRPGDTEAIERINRYYLHRIRNENND